MSNVGSFRSAPLGFNKKDVVEYIVSLKNEYYAFRQQSEKEIKELRDKIARLERQIGSEGERSIFDSEQLKLFDTAQQDTPESRIDKSAEKLEGLINEIESLVNKSENNLEE